MGHSERKSSLFASPQLQAKRSEGDAGSVTSDRPSVAATGFSSRDGGNLNHIQSPGYVAGPNLSLASDANGPITCDQCQNPITAIAVTGPTNKRYHISCFKCGNCKTDIANGPYFERNGSVFCVSCHSTLYTSKCGFCSKPISDSYISALRRHWHPDHFFCAECGVTFDSGSGFVERDGFAYCERDYYSLFARKCVRCRQPILNEYVYAMGMEFHTGCFGCRTCEKSFDVDGEFYDVEGEPFCAEHAKEAAS